MKKFAEAKDKNAFDRDTWTTPRETIEELQEILGISEFCLDPCSNERSKVRARTEFILERDGDSLARLWPSYLSGGCTFINPPYSAKNRAKWIDRIVSESKSSREMAVLVPLAAAAKWSKKLHEQCDFMLLPKYRLKFGAPNTTERINAPFDCAAYLFNTYPLVAHKNWSIFEKGFVPG